MNTITVINEPPQTKEYEMGDIFKCREKGELYILARISYTDFCMINLESGNRYDSPGPLSNTTKEMIFVGREAKIRLDF